MKRRCSAMGVILICLGGQATFAADPDNSTAEITARSALSFSDMGSVETSHSPMFQMAVETLTLAGPDPFGSSRGDAGDPVHGSTGYDVPRALHAVSSSEPDDPLELTGLTYAFGTFDIGERADEIWSFTDVSAPAQYDLTSGLPWMADWDGTLGLLALNVPFWELWSRFPSEPGESTDIMSDVSPAWVGLRQLKAYRSQSERFRTEVEDAAMYQVPGNWWFEWRAQMDRVRNEAADGPLVSLGQGEAFTISVRFRRAFNLDL
ncbi:MAG: hypothetical protein AAF965_02685 [Pseudomonadota bacterium]